jgi:UDP-N-acetylglucosamine 2-epimerase (non-hydrolysing)
MKIVSLVGARPQFVKEALISAAVRETRAWEHVVVHSGQHYDANMSDIFFQELGITEPRHYLKVGSGGHGAMTATALRAMEEVLLLEKPHALLVYGDTNTTLAGSLAAVKLHLPVIHVEAGIRQEPRTMPEEANRRLTDHATALSGGIFSCCSLSAADNLRAEGILEGIHISGDVMLDLFIKMRPHFQPEAICRRYGLSPGNFILVTLHRDFNVDYERTLLPILDGLRRLSAQTGLDIFFPAHPRTIRNLEKFRYDREKSGFLWADPVGYLDLMSLTLASRIVVTDSGGLQKEAFYAGKRALVLMPDTGWREITACGWNLLTDPSEEHIATQGAKLLASHPHPPGELYGNGNASQNLVSFLVKAADQMEQRQV